MNTDERPNTGTHTADSGTGADPTRTDTATRRTGTDTADSAE